LYLLLNILLKVSPFISIAICAPIKDPTTADAPQYTLNGNVEMPLDLYPAAPVKDCKNIPNLFVPFATDGGRPKKMSTGSVNKEPPPAMVFTNPAMKPTSKSQSKLKSKSVINITVKCIRRKCINNLLNNKL
jgi:hypothetical protein